MSSIPPNMPYLKRDLSFKTFRAKVRCQRCDQFTTVKLITYLEDHKVWKLCPDCMGKQFVIMEQRKVKKVKFEESNEVQEKLRRHSDGKNEE